MGTTTVEIRQLADNSGGTSIAPLTVAEAVFLNENVTLDKLVGNLDINGLNSNTLALTNSLTYKGVYNAIRYVGTSSTNSMIRFLDNNLNGDGSGISIGGGGATILGGGESALIMESALDRNDREVLYLCNDSQIDFYTNCQSGTGSAVHTWIDTSGFFNGSVKRDGISTAWIGGRDKAILKSTSINGYSATASIKTKNGSWEIGAYDNASYQNMLIFSYVTDANYSSGNNTSVTARITPAGAFTNASQRKLKENIKPYTDSALKKINDINICSFNMKNDSNKDYRIGFIADDTDSIFSGPFHEYMDLNNCVGMLLKAVQELSKEIDQLKEKAYVKNNSRD